MAPRQREIEEDAEVPSESDVGMNQFSPNDPHPSLEYPVLYYGLQRSPRLKESVKRFYSWRWSMAYPLQKRVKASRILRYFRIYLTYGEVLMAIPFLILSAICVYQTFFDLSVSGTGKAARLSIFSALLLAQKNSYLTMLLGVPFDRALVYHKMSGYVAVITGILHGVAFALNHLQNEASRRLQRRPRGNNDSADNTVIPSNDADDDSYHTIGSTFTAFFQGSINLSGTLILLCIMGMFVTSIPYIRKKLFEVFYYMHLVLLLGIIAATVFHTGFMVPLFAFLTTGIDFFVRRVLMTKFWYPKKATLRIISESVVELSFPKTGDFDYNPGQYVYISIPEISSFEWHPFSLSSSPHQDRVTLHIRDAGNWTFSLYKLALNKSEVSFMIEGPYGNFGVDVMSEKRYGCVLLLSGGIGLTPMQSMFSHLIHEQQTGSRLMKKLRFVWIQRDPELMAHSTLADTSTVLYESKMALSREFVSSDEENSGFETSDASELASDCASLATRILAVIPPSTETDENLNATYASDMDLMEEDIATLQQQSRDSRDDNPIADEGEEELPEEPEVGNLIDGGEHRIEDVLDIEIYLTKKDMCRAHHRVPGVKMGRPDLPALLVQMRNDAIRLGERRVAVCVCGPKRIAYLTRKVCVKLSDRKVRFDYHEESFG